MGTFANPDVPLGDWIADFIDWFTDTFRWLLDFIGTILDGLHDAFHWVLDSPIYWVMIIVFGLIAWAAVSWQAGILTALGFYLVRAVDEWPQAMETLSQVLVAVLIAVVLAVPLGIWAAKSETV